MKVEDIKRKEMIIHLIMGVYITIMLALMFGGFYDLNYNNYNNLEWLIAIIFLPLPSYPIFIGITLGMLDDLEKMRENEN
jgi:hypothetical protein